MTTSASPRLSGRAGAGTGTAYAPRVGMNKVWYLRRLDLFEGLSDHQLNEMGALFRDRTCRVGDDVVVRPSGDRVYIVKRGRVRVMGGQVAVAVLGPGQMFGTSSLFGAAVAGQRIVAVDDVVICDASAREFMGTMARHPLLAARLAGIMARQIVDLERRFERSAGRAVDARLAALLLEIAVDGPPRVAKTSSQAELAGMIGASRESVWRVLTRWERDGLVRVDRHDVTLLDEDRLREQTAASLDA